MGGPRLTGSPKKKSAFATDAIRPTAKTNTRVPALREPSEIVFGATQMMSGHAAGMGQGMTYGLQAGVEDINKLGGIYVKEYGKKLSVKCIYYDDESDPATAAELYRKLIEVDKTGGAGKTTMNPDPVNSGVYEGVYRTYGRLFDSLRPMFPPVLQR